jgi:hypothetical protein
MNMPTTIFLKTYNFSMGWPSSTNVSSSHYGPHHQTLMQNKSILHVLLNVRKCGKPKNKSIWMHQFYLQPNGTRSFTSTHMHQI